MSQCVKIQAKHRKSCIGSLNKRIKLKIRSILSNTSTELEPLSCSESFVEVKTVWANIVSKSGVTYFDQVGTKTPVSHIIYIRYRKNIDAETWVEFNDKSYDILNVENLDERDEYLKLSVTDRGLAGNEASGG